MLMEDYKELHNFYYKNVTQPEFGDFDTIQGSANPQTVNSRILDAILELLDLVLLIWYQQFLQ